MEILSDSFLVYVLVGFLAQLVDGALGMAYGTLSTSVLLASGMPPALASASVHTAQFFTTGLSGLSHALFKNVNWRLCFTLAVAGIVGGVMGAVFLTKVDGAFIRPWIAAYLMVLGLFILWRAWKSKAPLPWKKAFAEVAKERAAKPLLREPFLGLTGGCLDAIGGGGWGPIVTSGLLSSGGEPRYTIGSVNTAEFFVKTAVAAAFFVTIGFTFHNVVLGLMLGGVMAAPFGALILKRIQPQTLMGIVGGLIVLLSLLQLVSLLK